MRMNNYEHLIQGGIEALAKWKVRDDCHFCNEQIKPCDGECVERMEAWLRDDYVEPDSLGKLLNDLKQMETACDYYGVTGGYGCSKCPSAHRLNCTKSFALDVAERIGKLMG